MAGLRTCRNPLFGGKNELAEIQTKEKSTLAIFRAPTFTLAQVSTPTPAPGLLERYTNKDLYRATKLTLELFVKD